MRKPALAFFCLLSASLTYAANSPVVSSSGTWKGGGRQQKDTSQYNIKVSSGGVRINTRIDPRKDPSLMGGIIMSSGTLKLVMPGNALLPMKNNWTTTDGTIVHMTGQVIRKDGAQVYLKEGDAIMPDGTIKRKGK